MARLMHWAEQMPSLRELSVTVQDSCCSESYVICSRAHRVSVAPW